MADYFTAVSKNAPWPHKSVRIRRSSIQTDHPHTHTHTHTLCCRFVKHKHFFCERMYANSISLPLPTKQSFPSMIEVSREEQVYYLLQLSALFAVLCRSSAGLPLNAIRLRLWLFAFLIIAGMLFEACDKRSTTPPHLIPWGSRTPPRTH